MERSDVATAVTEQVTEREPQPAARPHLALRIATWAVPGLVAFAVGLWGLTVVSIDRDETATLDIGTRSLPQMMRMLQRDDAVHGLYYLLMHPLMAAFGTSPTVVRFPSLIAAALGASMLAVLGNRLVSRRAGFTAGLLYACAPQISVYAHDARSYEIDALLVIVATYLLVLGIAAKRRRIWVGYGAVAVVMIVFHVFTALVLFAHAVTVAWHARRVREWLPVWRWLVTMVLVAVVLSPFAVLSADQSRLLDWISRPTVDTVRQFFVLASGGTWLVVPMFGLAVLAWRAPRTWRTDAPSVFQVAWPWLLIPPALLLAASIHQPYYVFRYVLYTLPALFLLVAAALEKIRWELAVPVLLVLLLLMVPMQLRVRNPAVMEANDTKGVAAMFSRYKQPGDAILFINPSQRYFENSYPPAYAGLTDILLYRSQADTATFSGWSVSDKTLAKRLRTVDRVWAILYWDWPSRLTHDREVAQRRYTMMTAAGLHLASTTKFRGGYVALFTRSGE